ncbi:hypothetical protein [Mycobacterium talmoniae]|uniref:Uncharacterized protein n=1 Tax=Mycobacterium talmoniae TaxID=1858794 RepID=A0A1S1NG48_9MYCO|nr:hypothetical protein [Mycobacterium talmoniae]OHV00247.1 hypothetical protein BKN37_18310 [Mycobacterium talmoniae]
MTDARTVYVGHRATVEQVTEGVATWQKQTGDETEYGVDTDGDGYPGMGFAIDVYAENDGEQLAARDRIAAGIRPLLGDIPVATDSELDQWVLTSTDQR